MQTTSQTQSGLESRRGAVRLWLLIVAAAMVLTLLVGGATRLTESGLSIVEWKPVTGVMPPLSDAAWQVELDKYRETPQYRELNKGMSLDAFKTIYLWEWSHRLLARSVGAIFLLPFLWFLWRGWIEPRLRVRLWAIFGAGAALGAVGWWMVTSGLVGRNTSVSQYRLAFHLTLACGIYAAIVWTAMRMNPARQQQQGERSAAVAVGLMCLVLLQIYLGALVAGLDAGLAYNTWPLIDGAFVPDASRLWFEAPWWRNIFENGLTVQFNHRMLAYVIWIVAMWHAFASRRFAAARGAIVLAAHVTAQAALGIITLLYQAPLGLALAHQALGIAVLTIAVLHAARLVPVRDTVISGIHAQEGARS